MRLLRYQGQEPDTVDPYWDFDREPGAPYDADALRLWRTRVFLSGPRRATVQLRLQLQRPAGDREPRRITLAPQRYLLRFTGGPDLAPDSYVPIASDELTASPPMLVLAVNLSTLAPGDYVLVTAVLDAEQEEKEMHFRLSRRPFYMLCDPTQGTGRELSTRVRSCTGLKEIRAGERTALLTAHRWKVYRNRWTAEPPPATGYTRVEPIDIVAVTLFDDNCVPTQTRWHAVAAEAAAEPLTGWSRDDFDTWHRPGTSALSPKSDESDDSGFDLGTLSRLAIPFPVLAGLTRQPDEDGQFMIQSSDTKDGKRS